MSRPATPLSEEIAFRLSQGARHLSVRQLADEFGALGYALDRTLDCRAPARYLDSGRTYPACTTGLRELDTGLSAFNANARRDDSFRAMQQLRNSIFAVSRGPKQDESDEYESPLLLR